VQTEISGALGAECIPLRIGFSLPDGVRIIHPSQDLDGQIGIEQHIQELGIDPLAYQGGNLFLQDAGQSPFKGSARVRITGNLQRQSPMFRG